MELPRQQCIKCRGWYDRDVGFRRNPHSGARILAPEYRAACIGCEQDARDAEKQVDPFPAKARWTIRHHADKYQMATPEFIASYGWDVDRVAHLLRHAYDNTCIYCRRLYTDMRNGPADVTMDIVDPKQEPFLETNTQPCCRTCNTEKSDLPPEKWARKLRFWREYEANKRKRPTGPLQLQMVLELPL